MTRPTSFSFLSLCRRSRRISSSCSSSPSALSLVGYDNFVDLGSGLLPCWEKSRRHFRGGVRFDLSRLPSTSESIIAAHLTFRGRGSGATKTSCGRLGPLARLLAATVPWPSGYVKRTTERRAESLTEKTLALPLLATMVPRGA